MHECWICQETKPIKEFKVLAGKKTSNVCNSCRSFYEQNWATKEPFYLEREVSDLRRRYLITRAMMIVRHFINTEDETILSDVIFLLDEAF